MTAAPDVPRLSVQELDVVLGHGVRASHVLRAVSFDVAAGTTVGLVGESGSGKSTLARTLVGVYRARSGQILFDGHPIIRPTGRKRRAQRRRIQLIPQDPYSSLDPRRTVGQPLAEAIDPRFVRVRAHRARIVDLLEMVTPPTSAADRYPHEFSGGQRQRIAIARALAAEPDLIVADEITSALDVSTQADVLRLLERLRRELGLTMIFVSHNLAVVQRLSDAVLVLLHGELVEAGDTAQVFDRPSHDYTRRLITSVPGGSGFSLSITTEPSR